jgi:hypothetical protein
MTASADDDVPLADAPAGHEPLHDVGILLGEALDDCARRRPDEQRAVERVRQRAGEQQLTAVVRRPRQGEVFLAQRSAALQLVVGQGVLEEQVHAATLTSRPAGVQRLRPCSRLAR